MAAHGLYRLPNVRSIESFSCVILGTRLRLCISCTRLMQFYAGTVKNIIFLVCIPLLSKDRQMPMLTLFLHFTRFFFSI